MLMAALPGFSEPGDDFYEANLTLTRAARLEKEGDFKGALESSEKATRLLQALKQSSPDWNPSWIASKLENASQIRERVEPLAQKAPQSRKEDYSLKPGEWRDVTFERAYKAHEQQKTHSATHQGTSATIGPRRTFSHWRLNGKSPGNKLLRPVEGGGGKGAVILCL